MLLFVPLLLAVCPTAQQVEYKLAALRPQGLVVPPYQLDIDRDGEVVRVTAHDTLGGAMSRELPASAPCEELVDAAAVVLLAWEAELPAANVPEPKLPAVQQAVAVAPAPLELAVRVAASGQLWLSAASPTWGAQGTAELHGRYLGADLTVLGQGQRVLSLGQGRVSWSRFSLAVGPTARLELTPSVELSGGAALAMGPFFIAGSSFDQTHSLVDWDVGITAHAQVLLPGFFHVRPFVGLGAVAWLRRHIAEAAQPDVARTLPYLEVSPTLGLAVTP